MVDEVQRSLNNGKPSANMQQWLSVINKDRSKVIFLSSEDVDRSRWSERFNIKHLKGLTPEEGAAYISVRLDKEKLSEQDIPKERREEISKWLGGNIRALNILVSRLRNDTIDELIGIEPEAWECRNQEVSITFLKNFETELLSRALEALTSNVNKFFERISVFRRNLDKRALEAANFGFGEVETLKDELIRRFLIERHSKYYSMHSVLRESILLKMDESERKKAHKVAGNYFARHFLSRQIVVNNVKLGNDFIEAKYHLIQANDIDTLKKVVAKFENYIVKKYG